MMTNAQVAILAAANQFSGAEVDVDPATVQGIAARYKGWLDRKDREDAEQAAALDSAMFSRGGVDPEPPPLQDALVTGARNRHPSGTWLSADICAACGAPAGQPCRTDTGLRLLHGHVE